MWNSRALSRILALLLLHSVVALVSAQGSTKSTWNTLSGAFCAAALEMHKGYEEIERLRRVFVLSFIRLCSSIYGECEARLELLECYLVLGSAPLVVARGGFSGLFPDSSLAAYNLALITGLPNVVSWCDVQLTKDAAGICFPDVKLDNATDISSILENKTTTYLVNGVPTKGYFSVDYTLKDLTQVVLTQGVYSRTNKFDGNLFPIFTVDDLVKQVAPPFLWLNVQHDAFYTQHNLSMRNFVLSISRKVVVNYISSPEVGFLRGISTRFNPNITKLVFRFMGMDEVEPTTKQTYDSLQKNLTFIKTFASGILVPKNYIWPVDSGSYLQPHTSLVSDAHKVGLEVFASDFVNDLPISYNYSYDPLAEYLQFIDNGEFSVDGVLSDFPITPSEAVDCFAHLGGNATKQVNTLVISKYGASGDYPACTDLAYQNAISDGVDVLDCPVQMSKDGTPFCLSSIDLIESTTVAQSSFSRLATSIPEIKSGSGIFSFSLTWDDIKTLKPSILNPYTKYRLYRNPKFKNEGNFVTLSDFLSLAKNQTSLSGVMITVEDNFYTSSEEATFLTIGSLAPCMLTLAPTVPLDWVGHSVTPSSVALFMQNAAYLAEKVGLSITDAVLTALSKASYDKPGAQKVLIQSSNSSVLKEFRDKTKYELVYKIDENVGDAVNSAVEEIKSFADSVVVEKASVFPLNAAFLTGSTKIVPKLKSYNLSVYVETFSNEFVSQAWDFFSDATVEINTFVQGEEVDGVITDFPKTANRYRRNRCLSDKTLPPYMEPVKAGDLLQLVTKEYLPPAQAPLPPLTESEVSEPPLPATKAAQAPGPSSGSRGGTSPPGNAQTKVTIGFFLSSLALFVSSLLLF
ncbi:glycerophosphodiester phosphodiesterase GDPDL1-like [Senna tora]|uniref:glycerophosphodiester phosphodiesterase n=1 Tax=Senna tora TaxID=362788 RepID=A0A834WST3_9FABA|nr:glycerophosphodiester phosphodiesterase GDPDL1-like [Senna tora]